MLIKWQLKFLLESRPHRKISVLFYCPKILIKPFQYLPCHFYFWNIMACFINTNLFVLYRCTKEIIEWYGTKIKWYKIVIPATKHEGRNFDPGNIIKCISFRVCFFSIPQASQNKDIHLKAFFHCRNNCKLASPAMSIISNPGSNYIPSCCKVVN